MNTTTAKIRLQTALMLARDIQAHRHGDAARFDRMVDGHGKGVINLATARKNITATCEEVKEEFPVTARLLLNWVEAGTNRP